MTTTVAAHHMDPAYEDMVTYLNYEAAQNPQVDSDINDLEAAIYFFARRYHTGMDSNLFKAMQRSRHRPNPNHRSAADVSTPSQLLYNHLVGAFIEGA